MKMFYRGVIALVLIFTLSASADAGEYSHLSVGVAKEDITPVSDMWLGGYYPGRKSAGVHDPIEARALSLQESDGKIYSFVAVDLLGFLYGDVIRVRQELGMPDVEVFVMSSHTHSAPDTIGLYGPTLLKVPFSSGRDEAYVDLVIRKIIRAVKDSVADLEPALLFAGSTDFSMLRSKYGGPVDVELSVTGFKAVSSGRIKAVIVNVGCHPTTLTSANTLITSDFVGPLRNYLDRELAATALFVNGALGGVTHVFPHLERNTFEKARQVGKTMAGRAEEVVHGAQPIFTDGSVYHRRATVTIPLENRRILAATILGLVPGRGVSLRHKTIETEVNVLRFGAVTFVMVPGEMHPEPALSVKERFGPGTQVWSLANDEIGYILPTVRFYDPALAYWRGVSVGPETEGVIMEALEEIRSDLAASP
jgi:neutral ceramidase